MSNEPIITMVLPHMIASVWPRVLPLLAPVIEARGTHEAEDVRKVLMSAQAHLWMQWSGEADAALVTEFVNYPKGLALHIWLMGARDGVETQYEEITRHLEHFAKLHLCKEITEEGRKGFERKLRFLNRANMQTTVVRYPLTYEVAS